MQISLSLSASGDDISHGRSMSARFGEPVHELIHPISPMVSTPYGEFPQTPQHRTSRMSRLSSTYRSALMTGRETRELDADNYFIKLLLACPNNESYDGKMFEQDVKTYGIDYTVATDSFWIALLCKRYGLADDIMSLTQRLHGENKYLMGVTWHLTMNHHLIRWIEANNATLIHDSYHQIHLFAVEHEISLPIQFSALDILLIIDLKFTNLRAAVYWFAQRYFAGAKHSKGMMQCAFFN